jgi:hypothetical protein
MNWLVCISNKGFEASLETRKLYLAVPDERAASKGMLRITDESGESYLYPRAFFMPIPVQQPLEQMLLAA